MERKRVIVTEYIDPAGLEILARYFDVVYLPDSPKVKLEDVIGEAYGIGVRLAPITSEVIAVGPTFEGRGQARRGLRQHRCRCGDVQEGRGGDDAEGECRVGGGTHPRTHALSRRPHLSCELGPEVGPVCAGGRITPGWNLKGKTLGVVGLGRIGSETARKCKSGFGMNVVAYDPLLSAETFELTGYKRADTLGPLLEESDFVVLCVPLTAETTSMIGVKELMWMKPSAFIINTSRGGLIDEAALYTALSEGRIAGAAMDAFVREPAGPENPLLTLDNFIATPHVAGATREAMRRMSTDLAEEIVRVLSGERPLYAVNPEVYE
jgi:D-3-phosphoglycerate dehydrogenase / 2-oxoglutarate reductase